MPSKEAANTNKKQPKVSKPIPPPASVRKKSPTKSEKEASPPTKQQAKKEQTKVETTLEKIEEKPATRKLQVQQLFNELNESLDQLKNAEAPPKGKQIRMLSNKVKALQSTSFKALKIKKPRNISEQSINSGFNKPCKVTDKFCEFAGWEAGKLYSRNEVTKYLCNYIKEQGLQKEEDRRKIKADKKLIALLNLSKEAQEDLTYFSLQKYTQQIYVKE